MIKSIDLFSGIGGITLGFHAAGITTIAAVDNDESCSQYFPINFPKVKYFNKDISTINPKELLSKDENELTVIVGGPPCQGFSLIGLRDPNDPRSQLVFEFRRVVKSLRPKYFIMENVQGMLNASKGRYVEELVRLFEKDGYNVAEPVVLNACEYGVPQDRRRVFLFGTRKDLFHRLMPPEPTTISIREQEPSKQTTMFENLRLCPSVRDAISDLPEIDNYDFLEHEHELPYDKKPKSEYAKMMRGVGNFKGFFGTVREGWDPTICTNLKRTMHGQVLKKRFKETAPGKVVPVSRLFKLDWDGISNTIRAGTPRERGAYSSPRPVHPSALRCISVREGARLQGFPDHFLFHPTKWHGFRQIGNSVSPLLAKKIGENLIRIDGLN